MDSCSFQAVCDLLKEKHDRPGAIKRACTVVADCLGANKDNLRGFFEYCFPLLLKKIFGYDDREASWLFTVAVESRADDFNALIQLLAPEGPLLNALRAADDDQIIQFLFPPERLPAHTQELLRLPAGRKELDGWPQYKGRLRLDNIGRCQVHLNMFEFFMFWAAFYVLRGARSTDKGTAAHNNRSSGFIQTGARRLLGGGSSNGSSGSLYTEPVVNPRHPYFRLLRLYLGCFLPRPGARPGPSGGPGLGSAASGGGSLVGPAAAAGGPLGLGGSAGVLSGLAPPSVYAGGLLAPPPGDVLLSVLLEFWLTDAGEPLPPDAPAASASAAATAAAAAAAAGSSPQVGLVHAMAGAPGQLSSSMAARAWGAAGTAGMLGTAVGAADAALGLSALAGGPHDWGYGAGVGAAGSMSAAVVDSVQATLFGGAARPIGNSSSLADTSAGYWGGAGSGIGTSSSRPGASGTSLQLYSYQPPSEDQLMALTMLMKYIFVVEPPKKDALPASAQSSVPWLPWSPVATLPAPTGRLSTTQIGHPLLSTPSFSTPVQAVSRKLYRLLRRTFAQWQPSSSASLSKLIGLWLVVLAPWRSTSYSDTTALQQTLDVVQRSASSRAAAQRPGSSGGGGSLSGGLQAGSGGTSGIFGASVGGTLAASTAAKINRWGSEMVQVAHHLSHVRDHGDGQEQREGNMQAAGKYTAAWRAHVWAHLPFYTILLPAFLELSYSQTAYSSRMALNNVYRVLKAFTESGPELLDELRQAEEAYSQYCAHKLRRSEGELTDVLPWLAEQAADWEAAAAAGAPSQPPLLPDTRYRMFDLERGGAPSCMRALLAAADRQNINGREKFRSVALQVLPVDQLPSEELAVAAADVASRDLPKAGSWRGVAYHGDSMLRPIATYEVAWLARLLVSISKVFNTALGLSNVPELPAEDPPETILQEVLSVVRRRGWRLNLRFMAEKQTLCWLLGVILISRFFWALFTSEGGAFSYPEYEEEVMRQAMRQQ